MSERDYAPLSAVCVRTLSDKVYEKRKAAAFEIEKLVRECVAMGNHNTIDKIIKLLAVDFAASVNPNLRKGSLVGLAAVAIALGPHIDVYTEKLVRPIMTTMADTDSRVRYYACESLYNVTKVAREHLLVIFNDVFSAVSVAIADADQNVRSAAELLAKLTMSVVTEHAAFDLHAFVPVLKERMYTKNAFARSFHLAWIGSLTSMPESKLINYLPDILDQMFVILSDETKEIHSMCEKLMLDFLEKLKTSVESARAQGATNVTFCQMINVLVVHAQSQNISQQIMAAQWILEFVRLSRNDMLPHVSGIITALLPNLVFDDERRRKMTEENYKKIRELSNSVNVDLMKLARSAERRRQRDERVTKSTQGCCSPISQSLELESLVEVLTKQLQRGRVETKLAALRWIYHLFKICQDRMVNFVDDIFPVLLKTLSDTSDEVVFLNLQVLAEICSPEKVVQVGHDRSKLDGENPQFRSFLLSLLKLFRANRTLLETKGRFIIRQLCVLLSAEDIYRSLADLLLRETDLKFVRLMVETLNAILFTTSELGELRGRLSDLNSSSDSRELFACLYGTWCHSHIASLALCLLTRCYRHAGQLIQVISGQEVTLEMLTELDKLVQLIESPIFTPLRMELLDVETNADLVMAMQSLLMLLPQSQAFKILKDRLNCLQQMQCCRNCYRDKTTAAATTTTTTTPRETTDTSKNSSVHLEIDFSQLLQDFKSVQERHLETTRMQSQAKLLQGAKILDLSSDEEGVTD